jgi:2-methylcitrate dehydratase PrpD
MARSTAYRPPIRAVADLATERLAAYAAGATFEHFPQAAAERAKRCLVDAVACAIFGAQFPWSAMVLDEALSTGAGGPCRVPGVPGKTLHVPQAALVAGAFAHAFEYDNLRKPGAGVHAGATVALPALAMAQAVNASGKELIAAIIAGVEVMFRIGAATLHTPEHIGFHAPGMTGPFGSAAACASLMGLSARQTAHAFGIAGSLAGGLLAFAKAGSGGMANRGYEGPRNVIEGTYGVLEAFCEENDPTLLTQGLGQVFEIERVCFKRYPCHVTAHVPVQLLRNLMTTGRFGPEDIHAIAIEASGKVVSHHNERAPADIMLAQYSVPFCVAIAAFHDPLDPAVFCDEVVRDPRVRALAKAIKVSAGETIKGWGARLDITLKDGRTFGGNLDTWLGCPETPLSTEQLRDKFDRITGSASKRLRDTLFDNLMQLEQVKSLEMLALT